jgi:4-aminobutyrate aminotransferase/4-aminobutyrate aminotransferase/(S)-3-amino-2-methylpropionate transaminase
MSTDKPNLVNRDAKVVIRPWTGSNEPVPIVEASGCTVTDEDGNTFLDFTSGYFVNQAGHCHPRVVAAATEQLSKVTQVSGRHLTPPLVELAERMVGAAPDSVSRIFFTTGGSESNENALKMARQATGKTDVVCIDNAYHGLTGGVLGGCSTAKYRATSGLPDAEVVQRFYRIDAPYCYRCPEADDCATQCLDGVEAAIDSRPETAALLAEPVQAVGGIIPPEKWWERLDGIRKKRGLLLILDEIQTGMGRTGTMFAAEHYGLEPEIMTVGKGISGGVGALAGVLASTEIADRFSGGTTPTSAGNAVSAAAGVALFDILIDEGLLANCAAMGRYFTEAVEALDDPWVGDVRFKGLLGGVELVSDRESKAILPPEQVNAVKDQLHERGMLLTISGPHKNVLRLQPPLSITSAQLDSFVDALGRCLAGVRNTQ